MCSVCYLLQKLGPSLENSTIQKQRQELQVLIAELKDRDQELDDMVAVHQRQLLAWEDDRQKVLTLAERCSLLNRKYCAEGMGRWSFKYVQALRFLKNNLPSYKEPFPTYQSQIWLSFCDQHFHRSTEAIWSRRGRDNQIALVWICKLLLWTLLKKSDEIHMGKENNLWTCGCAAQLWHHPQTTSSSPGSSQQSRLTAAVRRSPRFVFHLAGVAREFCFRACNASIRLWIAGF